MNLLKFIQEPSFRINSAHFILFVLLLINVAFFTYNTIAIIIQLIIATAIILHHIDHLRTTKELIDSEELLREETNIFDHNVIVSETDLNGVINYVNENYLTITGYQKSELIGKTHAIIKSDEIDLSIYTQLYKTLNKNETFIGVFKNKKKDGSPFWVSSRISPIIINHKKIGYKAIMFDITDKFIDQEKLEDAIRSKEEKLQEQASRFEFTINSSRDGFWNYDLEKGEFYLSSGWKKRLGFSDTDKLTYLDYLSLVPDENRFEHHRAMHDLIEQYPNNLNYIHFRIRYPLITKDGEKLSIEDVGDMFFDKDKNLSRITGFHRDITDQERQLKIIESQNRMAEMGEMISNIAHQWRQPIGAINNTLNDLEFDIELEDMKTIESTTFLKTSSKIKEYTAYLSQTINDFRKLSSDEKQKSNFIVLHTAEQAFNIAKHEYKKHNIHFHLIESSDDVSELYGYNRELQQVIINLLNNAKDILIEKRISNPTVTLSIFSTTTDIAIIVHDNAGGISDSIMPKIFNPYFTTKHESMGTGIGLYMSKKIITEYFKGTIEVENENNGAKFTITLPKEP